MLGRPIPSEDVFLRMGYRHPHLVRRRQVLRETLAVFSEAEPVGKYQMLAQNNLRRWQGACATDDQIGQVRVISGDWGEVTHSLTKSHGSCFAVLNMANAYIPGGAYVEGASAQEENMFRRTNCHFYVGEHEYDELNGRYFPKMTQLISATHGKVYLDVKRPRVCIRGPEDRARDDLGYQWLDDDEVFPFFELRAAAQDLRGGLPFDHDEARKRIVAQLETLISCGIRYAVLGAIGCGAFENPAVEVASIYREELDARSDEFNLVAFAIRSAGYGPGNFKPFAEAINQS